VNPGPQGASVRFTNLLVLGVLLSVPASLFASEAHSRAFGPQSVVRVARPTLRWEVWPGTGSRVTDAMMTINGEQVEPRYDAAGKVLEYTPVRPLEPGSYKVACKVVVDNFMPVTKDWNFKIAAGAASLPQPSLEQVQEIDGINAIREHIGLPDMQLDPRLCAAAAAHTHYLALNGLTGHYQNPNDPGFVGATPADRLDAFGFSQSSWEGVDYGSDNFGQSLTRLFDAPYHRLPFIQPGQTIVGAGYSPAHMTIEFGMTDATATVESPAPNQQGVPLSWQGVERPDPLPIAGLHGVVGYPIVFSHFSPTSEKIVVESASLQTALGASVPFGLNTPANDPNLDFAAFVIPKRALEPNTGYIVSVRAHTASGKDISDTWRFVTGSR
jgi:uncharacterized protein YkwD